MTATTQREPGRASAEECGRGERLLVILPPLFDLDGDVPTAMVFDSESGLWYDDCWNLETAITYIHGGRDYIVIATGVSSPLSVAEVEQAIAHEYQLVGDCFGWPIPELIS